eukprot:2216412-Amphidinium_carterae.2
MLRLCAGATCGCGCRSPKPFWPLAPPQWLVDLATEAESMVPKLINGHPAKANVGRSEAALLQFAWRLVAHLHAPTSNAFFSSLRGVARR